MYSNLYLVLIKHKLPLKIDFRKNHFTSHVLISLKSLMKKNLDNDYFSCLIFIELQKTFYTVNYDVRLAKLQIISPKKFLHYQRVACSLRFNVMSIFVSSLYSWYAEFPFKPVIHHFANYFNLLLSGKKFDALKSDLKYRYKSLIQRFQINKWFYITPKMS